MSSLHSGLLLVLRRQEDTRAVGDALVKHAEAWFLRLKAFSSFRRWHLSKANKAQKDMKVQSLMCRCRQDCAGVFWCQAVSAALAQHAEAAELVVFRSQLLLGPT